MSAPIPPSCEVQPHGCHMFAEPDHCERDCYYSEAAKARRAVGTKALGGTTGHLSLIRTLAMLMAAGGS